MLKIRLSKNGYKKNKFFLFIVINSKSHREGKYIEKLGFYNFKLNIKFINIKKTLFWLNTGAKPTKTFSKLFNEYIKFNKK
ncbi:30S ribosomal protein S16 [Candidatus Nasuia deltocephalinicola]|nr:30S ribosomal protein S16 [Candidatus Nasuia deltocephalinicola]